LNQVKAKPTKSILSLWLAASLLLFLTAQSFAAANGTGAAERMLRVSYSAPATAFLPLWAAKEAGFFDRNNVNVESALVYNNLVESVARSGIVEQLYR
jgi:ABC-type nitrate/sulfonate/bicarbonate transport system substrate-binding protein